MNRIHGKWLAAALALSLPVAANAVYLNDQNSTVALGPSMSANPFANRTTAASLASIIDAPSATVSEFHNQSTHVWVSGGTLELVFDFQIAYDLTTLHFWNYHSEGFDVDSIDFTFFDASNQFVGSLLDVTPELGGSAPTDATSIFAQDYSLSFPSRVRYVNAVLSGSNGQVDFNNIGFTGTVSTPPIPEPATGLLLLAGLGIIGSRVRRKQG
jgi:PEP-CTERM motif